MPAITPCLWFDTEGEDAANLYVSVFENSRITDVTHYGDAGPRPAGTVLTVAFELDGQPFLALNGGPEHRRSPRPSPSRCTAPPRTRWTGSGSSSAPVGNQGPAGG